jgi:hypothetical protein
MSAPLPSRMVWYIEHRLEFLRKLRDTLKLTLEGSTADNADFEALREFLDVVGRIRELENLLSHAETW